MIKFILFLKIMESMMFYTSTLENQQLYCQKMLRVYYTDTTDTDTDTVHTIILKPISKNKTSWVLKI